MKICLASIHPRRLSGQIESLVALARELERLGHAASIVSAFDDDLLFRRHGALPEKDGDAGSLAGKFGRLARTAGRVAIVGRGADLIHLNLPTPAFSWFGDLVQARAGVPVVVGYEAHLADARQLVLGGYLLHDPKFYLPRILVNNGLWGRLSLFRCQRYLVASRWQLTEMRALGVDDARLVNLPNLIDQAKFNAEPPLADSVSRPLADSSSPLPPDSPSRPRVGWIGHYHHVKGVDVLLDAFARIVRRRPEARLILAWSGIGDRRSVESRIESLGLGEWVIRLGRVNVSEFFSDLDLLALPYRLTIGQNAYPNLVLEAMKVGVPLVTTDLPLLRELAADGRAALLATPGDPTSLAETIGRLLDQPNLAAALVAEQRTLMDGILDSTALAKRYVALYEEVLAEQARVLQPARRSS
jgi:glycosyltransferase involved in cell wall biosynthesis